MAYSKQQLIDYLYQVADSYGIDRGIAYRQINQESGFNPNAKSYAGAKGIAQFVDGTARRFGLSDPFDPIASLNAWGAYMSELLERFDYRYDLALAGYNSGEFRDEYTNAYNQDRAINWSVLPGNVPTQTRDYVKKILGDADRPYYASGDISQPGTIDRDVYESLDDKNGKSGELLTILAIGGLGILLFAIIAGGSSRR